MAQGNAPVRGIQGLGDAPYLIVVLAAAVTAVGFFASQMVPFISGIRAQFATPIPDNVWLHPVFLMIIHGITIICFAVNMLRFVWANCESFQVDARPYPHILLEIALFLSFMASIGFALSDIWIYRIFGTVTAILWLARCWVAIKSTRTSDIQKSPFLASRDLFSPILHLIFGASAILLVFRLGLPDILPGNADLIASDIMFSLIPLLVGIITVLRAR